MKHDAPLMVGGQMPQQATDGSTIVRSSLSRTCGSIALHPTRVACATPV